MERFTHHLYITFVLSVGKDLENIQLNIKERYKGKGNIMNQLDIFVRNLKNIINDRDIKLNNLAQSMGVSGPLVSNVLSGAQTPSMKFALKVCEVLNVSMAEMFTPDIRQFPVKQDVEESNLHEIIEMQRDQIAKLEEELESALEENEKLNKEYTTYRMTEDGEWVKTEPDDGKIKLIIKNGEPKAIIDGREVEVFKSDVGDSMAIVMIKADEVHIEY